VGLKYKEEREEERESAREGEEKIDFWFLFSQSKSSHFPNKTLMSRRNNTLLSAGIL